LKIWIFSVVAHALLLWALTLIILPVPEKPASSAVIQTYSYTQVREKPKVISQHETLPAGQNSGPVPVIAPPAKPSVVRSKTTKSKVISGSEGIASAEPATNMRPEVTKPSQSTAAMSLADRAFAAVAAKTLEPAVPRQQQPEVVSRSGSAAEGELAPAMLKTVKTYADGSELMKGEHGCWKIPPAESRKGAIWLMTSTPCETDTTVEQINDILLKRRTYAKD
jgi:hypothetical protein